MNERVTRVSLVLCPCASEAGIRIHVRTHVHLWSWDCIHWKEADLLLVLEVELVAIQRDVVLLFLFPIPIRVLLCLFPIHVPFVSPDHFHRQKSVEVEVAFRGDCWEARKVYT